MSHYSQDPAQVRVDFFKESGKWYCTEAVKWITYHGNTQVGHAFAEALDKHLEKANGGRRLSGMIAVCLEPYHEHAFPQMMKVDDIDSALKRWRK